ETHNQQKMHDEKRGERYFSMHRLTGAKLTKLIDVQLLNRECLGLDTASRHQTTAHTKTTFKTCQARIFYRPSAKLKLYFRLACPPCFISSQFAVGTAVDFMLNSRYCKGFTG